MQRLPYHRLIVHLKSSLVDLGLYGLTHMCPLKLLPLNYQ
jgi:hypothetical protein